MSARQSHWRRRRVYIGAEWYRLYTVKISSSKIRKEVVRKSRSSYVVSDNIAIIMSEHWEGRRKGLTLVNITKISFQIRKKLTWNSSPSTLAHGESANVILGNHGVVSSCQVLKVCGFLDISFLQRWGFPTTMAFSFVSANAQVYCE